MSVFDSHLVQDSSMSQGELLDKKTADAIQQGIYIYIIHTHTHTHTQNTHARIHT
jgi:hypothetical protein